MSFNDANFEDKLAENIPLHYVSKSRVSKRFNEGYLVSFASYILPQLSFVVPVEIAIVEENKP